MFLEGGGSGGGGKPEIASMWLGGGSGGGGNPLIPSGADAGAEIVVADAMELVDLVAAKAQVNVVKVTAAMESLRKEILDMNLFS